MENETYRSYRPKIPNQNFRNFFIYAKQPTFRESSLWANKQLVKNSKLLEAQ